MPCGRSATRRGNGNCKAEAQTKQAELELAKCLETLERAAQRRSAARRGEDEGAPWVAAAQAERDAFESVQRMAAALPGNRGPWRGGYRGAAGPRAEAEGPVPGAAENGVLLGRGRGRWRDHAQLHAKCALDAVRCGATPPDLGAGRRGWRGRPCGRDGRRRRRRRSGFRGARRSGVGVGDVGTTANGAAVVVVLARRVDGEGGSPSTARLAIVLRDKIVRERATASPRRSDRVREAALLVELRWE